MRDVLGLARLELLKSLLRKLASIHEIRPIRVSKLLMRPGQFSTQQILVYRVLIELRELLP